MTINIRFQLRLGTKQNVSKSSTNNKATIRCHVSVNAEKEILFSTGFQIEPCDWSQEFQCVLRTNTLSQEINDVIAQIRADLLSLFNDLKRNRESFNARTILTSYKAGGISKITFMELWEMYLSSVQNTSETDPNKLCDGTFLKYKNARKQFSEFCKHKKLSKNIGIHEIDKKLTTEYFEFLNAKEGVSPLHAYSIVSHIKKVLGHSVNIGVLKYNPFDSFSIRRPVINDKAIFYLSEADLIKLLNADFMDVTEREIVDGFLFMAFTGMNYRDMELFFSNINNYLFEDNDGYIYIEKRRFKDRKKQTAPIPHIPVTSVVLEIMKKYDFKLPIYANQTYNRIIKRIGYRLDIDNADKITTYTARKSAATYFANLDGVDIKTVGKILGHKHEATTRRHYAVTEDKTVKRQVSRALKLPFLDSLNKS